MIKGKLNRDHLKWSHSMRHAKIESAMNNSSNYPAKLKEFKNHGSIYTILEDKRRREKINLKVYRSLYFIFIPLNYNNQQGYMLEKEKVSSCNKLRDYHYKSGLYTLRGVRNYSKFCSGRWHYVLF